MQNLESLLTGNPFFEGLAPAHLRLIAGCGAIARFDSGAFIFRAGEPADQFYLIRHGKVAIEIFVPGRGTVSIQTIDEGDVLGWSWLFPPYYWHFDARALMLTRAFAFDGKCLRAKCEADHDLGYALMQRFAQVMAQRLQATRLQLLDVYGVLT